LPIDAEVVEAKDWDAELLKVGVGGFNGWDVGNGRAAEIKKSTIEI
jgi:hypothetical protein